MLSDLLDEINDNPRNPDWDAVFEIAQDNCLPDVLLLELAKALWLEGNDPEAYDQLVKDMRL